MPRNNYKQKWQNALDAQNIDVRTEIEKNVEVIHNSSRNFTDGNLELRKISGVTHELASLCKEIIDELNDHTLVGKLSFSEVDHEIDSKLSHMPVVVVLRRVRDIMRVLHARTIITSIHADDLNDSLNLVVKSISSVENSRRSFVRAVTETSWIGPSPTESEVEDLDDKGPLNRYDLTYEDLDSNWVETKLCASTTIVQPTVDESSSDSESSSKRISKLRRQAAIVPRSPRRTNGTTHADDI